MNLKTENVKESTVHLSGFGIDWTGFFVEPDRIATNFHVLAAHTTGPITAKLGHKETIWSVEGVVTFDIENDIAILKVKGEGVPLPLGDSDKLQIGEPVLLAGCSAPEGRYKVTEVVVKKIRNSDNCFQTTAEVYPGNSGSPVLNSKGEVIGIHYGHVPGNSPVNAIKTLLAGSISIETLDQWRNRKVVRAFTYRREGREKLYDGNSKGAIDDFNQAIKLNPDDANTYSERGWAKKHIGDHAGAIDDFTQIIKLNPDDVNAYRSRGWRKKHIGDHAGALEDFTRVIKLKPDDTQAFQNRAHVKEILGDQDGVIDDWTQSIKLKPDEPYAYRNRGRTKADMGDYTGAIADYNQALKVSSDAFCETFWAYKGRGDVQHKFGDYARAIEDYNQAIKLIPEEADIYNARGLTKVALKDYAGAIADYDKAIEFNPKYAIAYHNRGLAKEALGQHEAATVDFEKAKEIDPEVGK